MYKKLLISFSILIAMILSFTVCFANDNMLENAANGVRNVVGGAENAVEDAAKDVSNTSKEATNNIENGANNAKNTVTDNHNNETATTDGVRTNNYTATRTATDGTANTFMGMSATAWTWLIIGIAAIAIVALVWYYAAQMRSSNYDNKD